MIILDLDDFHEDNNSLDLLMQLKSEIPDFKVNLFTIVGRCSNKFLEYIKTYTWMDCIPHGFLHNSSRECEEWDFKKSYNYLKWLEQFKLTKGFKAPGWQINNWTYIALMKESYFVADQGYNNNRRPAGLKTYLLDSPNKLHGHIGHMGGHNDNELSLIMPQILRFRNERFGFIKNEV